MSHVIQNVDSFSHQGYIDVQTTNHYNEDRMVVGTYTFAAIDGATAITPVEVEGMNTSAYTSKFLADFIYDMDSSALTAQDTFKQAGSAFKTHLEEHHPHIIELGKDGPCAAAAMIKVHQGIVSYSNISDCSILAEKDGVWHILSTHSTRHANLDKELADYLFSKVAEGKSMKDARTDETFINMRDTNRRLLNIEYGVFNHEREMVPFLNGGTFKAGEFTRIVMFSDGMVWPDSVNEDDALKITAEKMTEMSVRHYHEMLKNMFASDPTFERYRRLKHMDDATGLVITL